MLRQFFGLTHNAQRASCLGKELSGVAIAGTLGTCQGAGLAGLDACAPRPNKAATEWQLTK